MLATKNTRLWQCRSKRYYYQIILIKFKQDKYDFCNGNQTQMNITADIFLGLQISLQKLD